MGWRNEPLKLGEQNRIIKVVTECVFEKPMVEIEHKDFQYSNTGGDIPFHGIQIAERLIPHEKDMLRICGEISDKILELHNIVNATSFL